jgi:hypothetical protein
MLIAFYELINANPTFQRLVHRPLATCLTNESQYTEDITLCAFISYSSFLLQSPRSKRSVGYSKLILLIFLRICEDNSLCKLFYSPQLLGELRLCRQVCRQCNVIHRESLYANVNFFFGPSTKKRLPAIPATDAPRPLACGVLDTMLIFITHNMRKKLEVDLYRNALSIIHRLLSYQIKHKEKIGMYHPFDCSNYLL